MSNLRFISWNVNGIRSALSKGLEQYFEATQPDFFCLQEVKAEAHQVDSSFLPGGYQFYWNPAVRKGYSGVAVLTRHQPLNVLYGLGIPELDKEGRVVTLEMEAFHLVNVYTPNSQNELARLDFRVNHWDQEFRNFLCRLDARKPVIFCGDLNVAHQEIDIANPKSNRRNPGFTDEERESFSRLLDAGFVDTFRHFESGGGHYSWWSYRGQARARNVGWRIDYFCASTRLMPLVVESNIHPHITGSDHCPVEMWIQPL